MYGTRDIERFSKRDKFQFKFKDSKPKPEKKGKKPQREKPQHKRWF